MLFFFTTAFPNTQFDPPPPFPLALAAKAGREPPPPSLVAEAGLVSLHKLRLCFLKRVEVGVGPNRRT